MVVPNWIIPFYIFLHITIEIESNYSFLHVQVLNMVSGELKRKTIPHPSHMTLPLPMREDTEFFHPMKMNVGEITMSLLCISRQVTLENGIIVDFLCDVEVN